MFKKVVERILFVGLILPALGSEVFAGDTKIGKYASEFISIGVGGRALGMGGAYVALASDVTAGYWNPAGLSLLAYPEITLMHDERFGSLINYDYGAVAIPVGTKSSIGFSIIRLGIDGIPDTRNALIDYNGNGSFDSADRLDYNKISFFSAADWAFYFTYSKRPNETFSYGANIKIIRRDLGDNSATGIGFDLGARFLVMDRLALGVNLQDVTTTLLAWDTGTKELISPTAKVGGAYFLDFFGGRLAPAVDFDIRFENRRFASTANLGPVSADLHAGLEFDFKKLVAFRVGYNDVKQFTLGAGVHLPKLDVDYSFAKFDGEGQLGNTHRISLKLTLAEDRFRRSVE